MRKNIWLLMCVGCFLMLVVGVSADEIPPAGKLVTTGSDPEVVVGVENSVATLGFPLTLGQREKLGHKSYPWQMSVSVARFVGDEWQLKAEEKDRYEVQTAADNSSHTIGMQYNMPTDGCDWIRTWGKSSADWLWISQSSKYYRKAQNGKPGYEALVCSDGKVHVVPDNYPLRP
ncbi:hypothetical protein L6270_03545 [Candidatus Parcubacteria bacterium]|nr:hypothetical protein [Patescibacteria group bacterium]MBU4309038.1 hypothetical protein [Patescibacteria group bacterium]MBU4431963.1 hypothetical protein [Patescibacteria group bacterium]MBU4577399.1 hypothetical protein [Patescibacteria group bacterium]MCG2697087.1 hypothetical protein [Candidatus Parcubacteria bacterium]